MFVCTSKIRYVVLGTRVLIYGENMQSKLDISTPRYEHILSLQVIYKLTMYTSNEIAQKTFITKRIPPFKIHTHT